MAAVCSGGLLLVLLVLAPAPLAGAAEVLCAPDGSTANMSPLAIPANGSLQVASQSASNMFSLSTCLLQVTAPAGYGLTFTPGPRMDVQPGAQSVYTNLPALGGGVDALGFVQLPVGTRCSGHLTWDFVVGPRGCEAWCYTYSSCMTWTYCAPGAPSLDCSRTGVNATAPGGGVLVEGQCWLFTFVDPTLTRRPAGCDSGWQDFSSGYRAADPRGGGATLLGSYYGASQAGPVSSYDAFGQSGLGLQSMLLYLNARMPPGTSVNSRAGFSGTLTATVLPPRPTPSARPSAGDQGSQTDDDQRAQTAGYAVLGVTLSVALVAGIVVHKTRRARAQESARVVEVRNPAGPGPTFGYSRSAGAPAAPERLVASPMASQWRPALAPRAEPPRGVLSVSSEDDPGPVEAVYSTPIVLRPVAGGWPAQAKLAPDDSPADKCPICADAKRDMSLSPCGHLVCAGCGSHPSVERCPICRTRLDAKIRLFF